MMRMAAMHWLVLGAALLAGCGEVGTDRTKAQLRLVNASSGYGALSLSIDDSNRVSSVGYGETASYVEVDPEPDKMDTVISSTGSATALVRLTPEVSKDRHYSLLAYGGEGTLKTLQLDDNTEVPDRDRVLLRVVNAAPDAGPVDVYLTRGDDSLGSAVATQAGAAIDTVGSYVTLNSGTVRLRITAANNKADLRLDVPGVTLSSQQVITLVVTPGRGGVLVNALFLVDRGGITRADMPQARVRAVAAVDNGGTLVASVGGKTVMNGSAAPALGAYTLVEAGTPALVVTVNGVAVSTAAPTLAAGGDYTLLVYGPAAAPKLSVIADDNRLPADGTGAKLRLVHGKSDIAGTLSLKLDFVPVAEGVAPGAASAYADAAATTSAELTVTTQGQAAVFSASDRTLLANGIYSLFAVDDAASGTGILSKDR